MDQHIADEKQKEAIAYCTDLTKRVWPVTGPAGVGKTWLIKNIYESLVAKGYMVLLCAPTAAAARRIWKSTGIEAATIHRSLQYSSPGARDQQTGKYTGVSVPKFTRNNPMPYDVIIGDEYAMVNWETHRALVEAIKPGAVLRPFGDVQQLQPIESADADKERDSPFKEMLQKFGGTTLTHIYRQTEEFGDIVDNCQRILKGVPPQRTKNYQIKYTEEPVKVLEEYIMQSLENGIDFSKEENQVITPMNDRWIGVHALNAMLQRCFYDIGGGHPVERHAWDRKKDISLTIVPGDKIVNWKNNRDLGFFNGEGGYVKEVTQDGSIVIVDEDREISVPPYQEMVIRGEVISWNPQRDLYLGYAKTTHKTQGNEYQNVVYVLNKSAMWVASRANFYTASSRARKSVHVITDQRTIWQACQRVGEFKPARRK
jgi:exodeoxyribonuclease V alpha subunit